MSEEALERIYTINLGKVVLSSNNHRAKRAINMIREFAIKHMKSENVKIEEDVSHLVWERGIRHPPRKIRVKMSKDDDGNIIVSKYQEETKVGEEKSKKNEKKGEKKVEEKSKEKKEEKKIVEEKPKSEEKIVEEKPQKEESKEEKKIEEKPKAKKEEKKVEKKVEEKPPKEEKKPSETKSEKKSKE
ncbi:MAG: 50S ribosomal protein L31e [Nitrosotalea sp.]